MIKNLFVVLLLVINISCSSDDPFSVVPTPLPEKPNETENQANEVKKNFSILDEDSILNGRFLLQTPNGAQWAPNIFNKKTLAQANNACQMYGGRLPTANELNRLATYLGKGTNVGFHPEYIDFTYQNNFVKWDFKNTSIWSSSSKDDHNFSLNGDTGTIESKKYDLEKDELSFLCILVTDLIHHQCLTQEQNYKILNLRQIIRRVDDGSITSTFALDLKEEQSSLTRFWQVGILSWGSNRIIGSFESEDKKLVSLLIDFYNGQSHYQLMSDKTSISCKTPRNVRWIK